MRIGSVFLSFVLFFIPLCINAQVVSDQDLLLLAEQGDAEAIYMLGYKGIGEKGPNYYYQLAAKKGHPQAIMHVLDNLLFRVDENADVQKAKEFADVARKMQIESQIHRNLDVVDICAKAGKPDVMAQGMAYSDPFFEACEDEKNDSTSFKTCLLKRGNNIDMAMIYANGFHVKQDFWKAISYACHGSSIPAELESMVKTLHKATVTGNLDDQPFSFCDHATGTHSTTACYQGKVAKEFRAIDAELDALALSFQREEKQLYEALQKRAFAFFDMRASSEQDLSGTMRGIFQTEWELEQRQFFVETLKKLEMQTLVLPQKDLLNTQKALDQLYADTIHSLKMETEKRIAEDIRPIISVEDVQMTQAGWTEYQEAFRAFAAKRYPKMNQDHFEAWLIDQRMNQLETL